MHYLKTSASELYGFNYPTKGKYFEIVYYKEFSDKKVKLVAIKLRGYTDHYGGKTSKGIENLMEKHGFTLGRGLNGNRTNSSCKRHTKRILS